MKTKIIAAAMAGLLLGTSAAWAAGYFPGFPPVNPFGTTVANQNTLPLTGTEVSAFDTGLPGGQNPQTELISVAQLRAYSRPQVVLTPGTTVATNSALASLFTLAPVQNFTLSNPTNLQSGQSIIYQITQDGTGSRVATYGSLFTFPGGTGTLSTPAGSIDLITCVYDGAGAKLRCTLAKAFA